MTASDLASIISGVAPVVREYVAGAIGSFGDRLQALEQRMAGVRDGKDGKDGQDGIGIEGKPGRDGKDAEPVNLEAIVARAAALIEPPEKGSDGAPGRDGKDAEQVDLDALAVRAAALIPVPKDGVNGKDVDASVVDGLLAEIAAVRKQISESLTAEMDALVARAVAAIPPAKDGAPGTDGVSVDWADIDAMVADRVAKAIAAVPVPKDGERGEPGERGDRGEPGASVDPTEVAALVAKAVDAIPRPQNGVDGRSLTVDDVAPLVFSEVQKAIADLPEPEDGVGVVGALIDRSGHLIVTLSDGMVKDVGPVVGQDGTSVDLASIERMVKDAADAIPRPQNGSDGKDGMGFDDMVVEHDGDRGIVVKLIQGDRVKTFGPFVFPVLVYKGVWKAGETYQQGETVTWGGSMWHANKSTAAKPGDGGGDWTLSVKKGSDGSGGKPGPQGDRGPRGEAGPMGPARYS